MATIRGPAMMADGLAKMAESKAKQKSHATRAHETPESFVRFAAGVSLGLEDVALAASSPSDSTMRAKGAGWLHRRMAS